MNVKWQLRVRWDIAGLMALSGCGHQQEEPHWETENICNAGYISGTSTEIPSSSFYVFQAQVTGTGPNISF